MAASAFHFYSRMFTDLSTALNTYVNSTASSIIGAITPVATTLLTLYVMLWGWSMMRGMISEPVTDGVSRIIRLAVITGIALNLGLYNGFVSDWIWNSPDALASYVGGGNGTTNAAFLDSLMSQMYDFGDAYYQKAYATSTMGIPSIGLLIMAYAIWGAGVLATGYGGFLLALAKIGLAVALGVGPMFILLTIFEPTKKFFDAWLGQALNYVFLVMLSAATIKLILTILQHYLGDASGTLADPSLDQALPAIVFSIIGALALVQMPSMASALGGGVAIGTLGAAGWAYNKTKNATGAARDVASGKTLSDLRGARRAKQNNAKWAENNPGMARRAAGAPMAAYRKITGGRKNRVQKG